MSNGYELMRFETEDAFKRSRYYTMYFNDGLEFIEKKTGLVKSQKIRTFLKNRVYETPYIDMALVKDSNGVIWVLWFSNTPDRTEFNFPSGSFLLNYHEIFVNMRKQGITWGQIFTILFTL